MKKRLLMSAAVAATCMTGVSAAYADSFEAYLSLAGEQKQLQLDKINAFPDVFENLGNEDLERRIENAYAESFYFNDTLVTITARPQLVDYLTTAGEKAGYVRTTILDIAESGDDVYVRWRLEMSFDVMGKTRQSDSVGVTQLRFDDEGKIKLHQDFWDSAGGFYGHLPVIGSMMAWVKKRLHP